MLLAHYIKLKEGPVLIKIERDGIFKNLTLVPKNVDGKGTIGAQLQPNIRKETKKTKNISHFRNPYLKKYFYSHLKWGYECDIYQR